MTRNEIIEQVNDLLEEEFEIEYQPGGSRSPGSVHLQDHNPRRGPAEDEDLQRSLRLH